MLQIFPPPMLASLPHLQSIVMNLNSITTLFFLSSPPPGKEGDGQGEIKEKREGGWKRGEGDREGGRGGHTTLLPSMLIFLHSSFSPSHYHSPPLFLYAE